MNATTPRGSGRGARAARGGMRGRGAAGALGLAVVLAIAGCSPGAPTFNAIDITGAEYAKGFTLTDHEGRIRSLADFRGKVVTMFFGFTHCPDVCPTTLARMAEVMNQLGPDAGKVQVLFVTVDPERDTQALLRQYVPAFHPTFIGLRTDLAGTVETAKHYKVFFQKVPGTTPETYSVDHTAFTYVYDPSGRLRLLVKHDVPPEKIAADIRTLLAGS